MLKLFPLLVVFLNILFLTGELRSNKFDSNLPLLLEATPDGSVTIPFNDEITGGIQSPSLSVYLVSGRLVSLLANGILPVAEENTGSVLFRVPLGQAPQRAIRLLTILSDAGDATQTASNQRSIFVHVFPDNALSTVRAFYAGKTQLQTSGTPPESLSTILCDLLGIEPVPADPSQEKNIILLEMVETNGAEGVFFKVRNGLGKDTPVWFSGPTDTFLVNPTMQYDFIQLAINAKKTKP